MLLKKSQLNKINNEVLRSFSSRMVVSLQTNLEIDLSNDIKIVNDKIAEAVAKFNIKKESNIEEYLLIYFSLFSKQKHNEENLMKILLNKKKPEDVKIEDIYTYYLTIA